MQFANLKQLKNHLQKDRKANVNRLPYGTIFDKNVDVDKFIHN